MDARKESHTSSGTHHGSRVSLHPSNHSGLLSPVLRQASVRSGGKAPVRQYSAISGGRKPDAYRKGGTMLMMKQGS